MNGTRVTVLRGGPSVEHDISMLTGLGVLQALSETPHTVKDIVISKKGEWLLNGYVKKPQDALIDTDVVFIALHGAYGEDGTVQRILERLAIPYTGSGPFASNLAMSKVHTKNSLKDLGIKMPKHIRITREGASDISRVASSVTTLFGPQYFIKPEKGGSSIGTRFVESPVRLADEIRRALDESDELIIEERIKGKEATVGVLENYRTDRHYVLPPTEIIPPEASGYFAANVKYTGDTKEICPGLFSKKEKQDLLDAARKVHQTLNLRHYSRSDFIVAEDGVYFLEVNTLPGLTAESLFPKSMLAVGATYTELVSHLIGLAQNTKR